VLNRVTRLPSRALAGKSEPDDAELVLATQPVRLRAVPLTVAAQLGLGGNVVVVVDEVVVVGAVVVVVGATVVVVVGATVVVVVGATVVVVVVGAVVVVVGYGRC
jgi:hypothetical protein